LSRTNSSKSGRELDNPKLPPVLVENCHICARIFSKKARLFTSLCQFYAAFYNQPFSHLRPFGAGAYESCYRAFEQLRVRLRFPQSAQNAIFVSQATLLAIFDI